MDEHDEIWDEFKWEEFMQEQDRKVDRLMELYMKYQDDPDCENIIAREMGWDWMLEELDGGIASGDLECTEEDDGEFEEGEEWKSATGYAGREIRDYHLLPAFQLANAYALRVHRFVESLKPVERNDSSVVEFLANAMIASAKIAGGSVLGEEIEQLGGNIAYCKRGLAASNLALAALSEMRTRGLVAGETYRSLADEGTEVRNAIALLIVDLRERFRRGV